jgi:hypothetical protein
MAENRKPARGGAGDVGGDFDPNAKPARGETAYADMNAHDQAVEDAKALSIFDLARRADIRHEGEQAAAREQDSRRSTVHVGPGDAADEEGVARKAGHVTTEYVPTPFSLTEHPDGTPKRMVICRPNGSGEREVTVAEWDRIQANPNLAPGAWVIKFTEVIAPHHSDDF